MMLIAIGTNEKTSTRSCNTDGLDVTYLVAYLKGGPAPVRPDCGEHIIMENDMTGKVE